MSEQKRRRVPAWVTFTGLRLVFFAVPLLVIYALGGSLIVAAVFAAILGLCLSIIFLGKQRTEAVGALRTTGGSRRAPRRTSDDEDAEDAAAGPGERPAGDQNASAAPRPKP